MTKRFEYQIEGIEGKFEIIKNGFFEYRSFIKEDHDRTTITILRGCSKDGAMRSIEGYLIGKYKDKLDEKEIQFWKAGWLEQFQTYPTKSRGKKN